MAFLLCAMLFLTASTNAEYPGKIDGPVRLNDTIAIIGGGFGAIHMALLMKYKGFTNFNILVEGSTLGGEDTMSRTHRGTVHEMGKHMFIPAHISKDVDDAMALFGQGVLTDVPMPTVWVENSKKVLEGKTLDQYMKEKLQQHFPNFSDEQMKNAIIGKLDEFKTTVSSLFTSMQEAIPNEPSWSQKFKLGGSFKDFLVRNNFQSLVPLFTYLFGMMGHGRPEDHPCHYGIFFFKPQVLEGIKTKLRQKTGLGGLQGYKINAKGFQTLLEAMAQSQQMNVTRNVRIDDIKPSKARHMKHALNMDVNGVQKMGYYDFIIFTEDLKKYVALNKDRTQREYQMFLRPRSRYIVKTLVDSLNVPRGSTPLNFYADSFKSGGSSDYKLAFSIDSYGTYQRRSGTIYQQNTLGNSNDPQDTKKQYMSAVYTQMSRRKPTIATANNHLLTDLTARGGTNLAIVDTKWYKFFPIYADRDLNNGMLYMILKMQGKNKIWYLGKSVYLDSIIPMMEYNKMLLNKMQFSTT